MKTVGFCGLLIASVGCAAGEWSPAGVGPVIEIGEADDPSVSFADDLEVAADPWAVPEGATLAASDGDAAPRVFYLHYADGGPAPTGSSCGSAKPTPFKCSYGTSIEDCQKKIQVYLDKWYRDFNLVFTVTKPTSGKYYAEVITSDGAWCGKGGGIGGVAPFMCGDMQGGVCYAFMCGVSAKSCAVIIAQEHAHLVGLLHVNDKNDLLYPTVCSCDGFQDKPMSISGDVCKYGTQNSYQMMKKNLGAWPGGDKPGPFGMVPGGGGGGGGAGGAAGGGAAGAGGAGGAAGAGGGAAGSGGPGGAGGDGAGGGSGGGGGAAGNGGGGGGAGGGGSGGEPGDRDLIGGCSAAERPSRAAPTLVVAIVSLCFASLRRRRPDRS